MIRARFTHTVEDTIDFPDDFKIQSGDGMIQIKDPKTNNIIFQGPVSNVFLYRVDNPPAPPIPMPPSDVPASMRGGSALDEVQP